MSRGKDKKPRKSGSGKYKRTVKMCANMSVALTGVLHSPERIAANSIAQIKRYKDPKEHEKTSVTIKEAMNHPDVKANCVASAIKRYEDPKEHEKTSVTTKEALARPDVKARHIESLADPDVKVRQIAGAIESHNTLEYLVSVSGKNHWNWQGGLTPLYNLLRNSLKSKQWTKDVFIRDKFTCQKCGKTKCRLEAHHKKPFMVIIFESNIITYEEAINCLELWNINNGITLCEKCHEKEQGLTLKQVKKARKEKFLVR